MIWIPMSPLAAGRPFKSLTSLEPNIAAARRSLEDCFTRIQQYQCNRRFRASPSDVPSRQVRGVHARSPRKSNPRRGLVRPADAEWRRRASFTGARPHWISQLMEYPIPLAAGHALTSLEYNIAAARRSLADCFICIQQCKFQLSLSTFPQCRPEQIPSKSVHALHMQADWRLAEILLEAANLQY